ncbi:YigZ family protein [Candidatus Bipolaricaulota bacterium]|nr:YigZ family protein [Candidatus Bipolaricaulota bacterium]
MSSMWTLAEPGRGKLVEKRSRFLSFAYPLSTAGEAAVHVDELRREYRDARHVVYAYRVLKGKKILERADDAGEPARSAGWAILELLRGKDLVNVLVVVVRYFGGVKLGVGGLRRAYRDAASLALEDAGIVQYVPRGRYRLTFHPEHSGRAFSLLSRLGAKIRSREYVGGRVVVALEIPWDRVPDLEDGIRPWGEVRPVE